MTKLDKRFLVHQYLQSPSCHFQLTGLYGELTAATNTLTLAISTTICKHTRSSPHPARHCQPPCWCTLTSPILRPHSTPDAEVDIELHESFLVIKWEDKGFNTDTVTEFEVQYSEERGQSVHWQSLTLRCSTVKREDRVCTSLLKRGQALNLAKRR